MTNLMRARSRGLFPRSVMVLMARWNIAERGRRTRSVAGFEGTERRTLDVGPRQREGEQNDQLDSRPHA